MDHFWCRVPYNLEARIWVDYLKIKYPNGTTVALLQADNEFGKAYEYLVQEVHRGYQHQDSRKPEARSGGCPTITNADDDAGQLEGRGRPSP